MIEYRNLSAWYPTLTGQSKILENCNFSLKEGTITALSGLNGSGKTTLLKILLGISRFSRGDFFHNGEKKESILITEQFRTGYAPEITSNSMTISPLNLFSFNDLLINQKSLPESPFSIHHIVHTFDLDEYASMSFNKLSKGTKKRVLIANAFLNNPQVLMLDEPFEGLDQKQRNNLKDLLVEFKQEKMVLISSHELLELKSFCDDHLHIEDKKILTIYD